MGNAIEEGRLPPLPRGCSIVDRNDFKGFLLRSPAGIDQTNLDGYLKLREENVKGLFLFVIQLALADRLSPNVNEELKKIDPNFNMSLRRILTRGILDIQQNRFVITSDGRFGFNHGEDDHIALGNYIELDEVGVLRSDGKVRVAKIAFVGFMFNLAHPFARAKEGVAYDITDKHVREVLNAAINAERQLMDSDRDAEYKNQLFSQEEIDAASRWVMFGER